VEGQEHPLCALYNQSCREGWEEAVAQGLTKVVQIIRRFRIAQVPVEDEGQLRNLNTPGDWQTYLGHPRK
jgi:molybdopterin-guanine dinucleotide biosynthesis protein A